MAQPQISFHRLIQIEAEVEESLRLFDFSAGWVAPIDPLSGMGVDLIQVDSWMQQAATLLEGKSFKSIAALARFICSEGFNSSRGSSAKLKTLLLWDGFLHEGLQMDGQFNLQYRQDLQLQVEIEHKARVLNLRLYSPNPITVPHELPFPTAADWTGIYQQLKDYFIPEVAESLKLEDPKKKTALAPDLQF